MQWKFDVTFYMASACKKDQNFPILMLGSFTVLDYYIILLFCDYEVIIRKFMASLEPFQDLKIIM